MKVYDNFKDLVQGALDKLADKFDPDNEDEKGLTYEDSVTQSLDRIAETFDPAQLLPKVTTSNNGKILKVTSGKWATGNAPTGLPSVSASDNGKILKVVDGSWVVDYVYESDVQEDPEPPVVPE